MINIFPEKILKALKEVNIEKTFINKLTEKNIEVVKTQNEKFGDYTSNILMVLKKQNIDIDYNLLIDILNKEEFVNKYIESINYISPGFLNTLKLPCKYELRDHYKHNPKIPCCWLN